MGSVVWRSPYDAAAETTRPAQPSISPGATPEPWGRDYVIGHLEGREFEIVSFGSDGKQGTRDDVVYDPSELR